MLRRVANCLSGVNEKTLKVGFNDGVEVKNLTLRTDFVNQMLQVFSCLVWLSDRRFSDCVYI